MNADVQKQLFNEFIQLDALSRKAVTLGLDKSADYGLQVHNLKKNLLAQALLSDFEKDNPITDTDLQTEYDKAKPEFEVPQIKGRHILVKTEEEAEAIIVQLNKGADFAKLATEKSTGPSGPKGGDLGWFSPKQMVKPFADAISALEDGKISETPVQTQFGFHVIKKEGARVGEAPPLENLRPRIEQQIKQQRVEKYLDEIRKELAVEELFTPSVKAAAPAATTEAPVEVNGGNNKEKEKAEEADKK
jgi:peptidyl-prolyl cis-trans isomerase C